jgi:hypothetical protein
VRRLCPRPLPAQPGTGPPFAELTHFLNIEQLSLKWISPDLILTFLQALPMVRNLCMSLSTPGTTLTDGVAPKPAQFVVDIQFRIPTELHFTKVDKASKFSEVD